MKHIIRRLWLCERCGQTDRHQLIRRKCKMMSIEAKERWLHGRDRTKRFLVIENCFRCGIAFFRFIVDLRYICYACAS